MKGSLALPANYVTLKQLQDRRIQEEEERLRKLKEEEEEEKLRKGKEEEDERRRKQQRKEEEGKRRKPQGTLQSRRYYPKRKAGNGSRRNNAPPVSNQESKEAIGGVPNTATDEVKGEVLRRTEERDRSGWSWKEKTPDMEDKDEVDGFGDGKVLNPNESRKDNKKKKRKNSKGYRKAKQEKKPEETLASEESKKMTSEPSLENPPIPGGKSYRTVQIIEKRTEKTAPLLSSEKPSRGRKSRGVSRMKGQSPPFRVDGCDLARTEGMARRVGDLTVGDGSEVAKEAEGKRNLAFRGFGQFRRGGRAGRSLVSPGGAGASGLVWVRKETAS